MSAAATQEQLARVQSILQNLDHLERPGVENRRQAARVAIQVGLRVVVLGISNPAPVQVYTRNFSTAGIGFVSRRLFKVHERFVLFLHIQQLQPHRLILARTTFGRYAGGGYYEMGAEFLESVVDAGNERIPSHWLLAGGSAAAKEPASAKRSQR